MAAVETDTPREYLHSGWGRLRKKRGFPKRYIKEVEFPGLAREVPGVEEAGLLNLLEFISCHRQSKKALYEQYITRLNASARNVEVYSFPFSSFSFHLLAFPFANKDDADVPPVEDDLGEPSSGPHAPREIHLQPEEEEEAAVFSSSVRRGSKKRRHSTRRQCKPRRSKHTRRNKVGANVGEDATEKEKRKEASIMELSQAHGEEEEEEAGSGSNERSAEEDGQVTQRSKTVGAPKGGFADDDRCGACPVGTIDAIADPQPAHGASSNARPHYSRQAKVTARRKDGVLLEAPRGDHQPDEEQMSDSEWAQDMHPNQREDTKLRQPAKESAAGVEGPSRKRHHGKQKHRRSSKAAFAATLKGDHQACEELDHQPWNNSQADSTAEREELPSVGTDAWLACAHVDALSSRLSSRNRTWDAEEETVGDMRSKIRTPRPEGDNLCILAHDRQGLQSKKAKPSADDQRSDEEDEDSDNTASAVSRWLAQHPDSRPTCHPAPLADKFAIHLPPRGDANNQLSIPDSHYHEFLKCYAEDIDKGIPHYMSEFRSEMFRHHVNLKFCRGIKTFTDQQLPKLVESLGRLLIRETRRFYPPPRGARAESLAASEQPPSRLSDESFELVVLGARSKKNGAGEVHLSFIFSNLYLKNPAQLLALRKRYISALHKVAPDLNWEELVNQRVYKKARLRLLYSKKSKKCPARGSHTSCERCTGTGRVINDFAYVPWLCLDGCGMINQDLMDSITGDEANTLLAVAQTSIRCPDGAKSTRKKAPSSGIDLKCQRVTLLLAFTRDMHPNWAKLKPARLYFIQKMNKYILEVQGVGWKWCMNLNSYHTCSCGVVCFELTKAGLAQICQCRCPNQKGLYGKCEDLSASGLLKTPIDRWTAAMFFPFSDLDGDDDRLNNFQLLMRMFLQDTPMAAIPPALLPAELMSPPHLSSFSLLSPPPSPASSPSRLKALKRTLKDGMPTVLPLSAIAGLGGSVQRSAPHVGRLPPFEPHRPSVQQGGGVSSLPPSNSTTLHPFLPPSSFLPEGQEGSPEGGNASSQEGQRLNGPQDLEVPDDDPEVLSCRRPSNGRL
ncbi:MAG: hypothetical protein KIY12_09660 [Thermoplasmata archaeon]|uniref:Uncharacterized protein n=1 Tax=Candidatus Sysuiplasma superficiale TaxID=2823368 RepID=A0A8J8CE14_9ARCH|nr:hypothetical protein [Candidatus Sysuiplasma superficiale]